MDIEVQDLSQKDIFSSVDMRWSEVLKGTNMLTMLQ